ncbi:MULTISPECIES: helix-turn-helix domain-containing protein [unclassified Streptomyces]|uniref:PucR family transcriptional regulator n=1 Tax=unclassified Streptomyces TaxID=2593676 RepID=UPI000DB9F184|nr:MULTISPECIES: helix-turn-helix domain-containing protein [unclassified Streptomyces]MYT70512.1 PucR family transcriptional regulator [Streptomyces sp. SID8367]RAJ90212.1 PucR-like helix-turn-helix protein [Streptomyces sp. PsTaAH-137]
MPAHLVRPKPVTTPAAVGVLRRAALPLLGRLPVLTDRLVAELAEREPAYRAAIETDPVAVRQEVQRSLRHSVDSLLDPARSRTAARACSARIGAERAADGLPLDAVLHAFRLGGALIWQALVDEVTVQRPEDAHLLVHLAADVRGFVDEHCACVADAYRQAEHELSWRRDNRRRLMTAALLDGSTRIADLPAAAAELGLPEQGRYAVVLVAGAGPGAPPAPPGEPRAVWHTGPDGRRGIVPLADRTGAQLAAACRATTDRVPGLRIGVSPAVEGLAAVGAARRLAETALRICPATGGTVLLDDELPAALVAAAPGLGRLLADRVLGPLLALPPADRDVLLDTLTVWLDCDGSAQRAAARLYCHRNTVLNRLRRCEQLTARSLTRPADLVELGLALSAYRLRRP